MPNNRHSGMDARIQCHGWLAYDYEQNCKMRRFTSL